MHSWSVFFLYNAVFAGLIALSLPDPAYASVAITFAGIFAVIFLVLLWLERGNRNNDV